MANKNIEIEIQVKIENSQELISFLKMNGTFKHTQNQLDEYYTPAHEDYSSQRPVIKWLRLRNSSGKYSMTYKKWSKTPEGQTLYCDEYETEVSSDVNTRNILLATGFKLIVTVDKAREIWQYQDYEIAIDTVKNLGTFVEVEYTGTEPQTNAKAITLKMIEFLRSVNCGKIERSHQGYAFELMFPNEVEFESV